MKKPIPRHHTRPTSRLNRPFSADGPLSYEIARLVPQQLDGEGAFATCDGGELVFDPAAPSRSTGLVFSGDFECGNLGEVYKIGERNYVIHILPDPTKWFSALWFMFKVENMRPGTYTFTIAGFYRDCHQHAIGVQPCAFSEYSGRRGRGWMRIGTDMRFWSYKRKSNTEYALSFTFVVSHSDTMVFAYLYPYSYTTLQRWLTKAEVITSAVCRTAGGVDVPAIFWDADDQAFVDIRNAGARRKQSHRPLVVIGARVHPGESNSSFAMEGLMEQLFGPSGATLRRFSWFLLPMLNPDGVVCGFYRPTIGGADGNRVWKTLGIVESPTAFHVVRVLDMLTRTRKLAFFLDFHGHTAQSNAFSYGVSNCDVEWNDCQSFFPQIMARYCNVFDSKASISFAPDEYPTTMRVALHHKYSIPFAYTLEMSFGAIEIGPDTGTQMTPEHYRSVGRSTASAIYEMLMDRDRFMSSL